ncbi:MAG: Uma2 family endonuclease [Armatimonadota bacterium]|nr:Uma2 family endonuclease [bacterium]MDW8321148.1 Uma2 family endonuclease [Armatimonadota bacterium]
MTVQPAAKEKIIYPDSDGRPMADNTKQLEAIVYLYDNLSAMFADREDVFVAADLLWYPVEGRPDIRTAPDAMVAFGRPKGHRGSYKQWEEANVAPQVVFEVLSPGNRPSELIEKFHFYERYGVEEYYLYDPDRGILEGWLRTEGRFSPVQEMQGWVSPRLGVRFTLEDGELVLYRPDGERFIPYVELHRRLEQAQWEAERAQREAEQERQRAREATERAERLAQRLREMGVDPDSV